MIEKPAEKKKKNDLLIRTIILGFIVLAFCCTFFFKTKLRVEFHLNEITQVCVCMCVCVHAHAKLSKCSDHF